MLKARAHYRMLQDLANIAPPHYPGDMVTLLPQNPLLVNAYDGNVFRIVLSVSVNDVRMRNVSPGLLYTFIIRQTGSPNTFQWPATVRGGMMICRRPHSTSVQTFIGRTGGDLLAITAGTWTL